jgi:uncharacterized membrane protein YfhO
MMEAVSSSATSVLTRATRRNTSEDGILLGSSTSTQSQPAQDVRFLLESNAAMFIQFYKPPANLFMLSTVSSMLKLVIENTELMLRLSVLVK